MNPQSVIKRFGSSLCILQVLRQSLLAFGMTWFAMGVVQAAGVSVDQSPLIIQKPLPPNIVLMLDDSGSMGWAYMPDWGYLSDHSDDAVRSSSVNGVYYNPNVTYTPPKKADGTSYPDITTFPNAPVNGFDSGSAIEDLSQYDTNNFPMYVRISSGTWVCPPGTSPSNAYPGMCYSSNDYSGTVTFYTGRFLDNQNGYWYYDETSSGACPPDTRASNKHHGKCYSSTKYDPITVTYNGVLKPNGYYYYDQVCTGGDPSACVNATVFSYSTGSAAPFQEHYVTTDCSALPSSYQANCEDSPAVQQNVANWFAYYHTRILMAKTGLMNSFSTLDPAYRVGFGSIDNNNSSYIRNNTSHVYLHGRYIAQVAPWAPASGTTQKSRFWDWLIGESANHGTPLRDSLKAVGEYYKKAQPWESSDSGSPFSCRQSYAILTTDGFWNGSSPGVGNADNTDGDSSLGSNYYQAKLPFKDGEKNTLADVAMEYWKTDLRSGLTNNVPTTPNDNADWQHMTTFTIGLGFDPKGISPSGTTIQDIFSWAHSGSTSIDTTQFSWPRPHSDSINNIADLAHAAVNGHGAFFSAKDPQQFTNGLSAALAAVNDRLGAANSLSTSGNTLPTSTSSAGLWRFQATFYTGQWTGTLVADKYDTTTGKYVQQWNADNAMPAAADRNIWTVNQAWTGSNSQSSVAFKNTSKTTGKTTTVSLPNISSAEQNGLSYSVGSVSVPKTTMLDYLRGDTTYEQGNTGGVLRARKGKLGDIVASTPVYVGAPNADLFEGTNFSNAPSAYTSFAANESSRTPLVYVAGNDGMLHAFRVEQGLKANGDPDPNEPAGKEVYAYMPGAVLRQTGDAQISNLANPDYGVIDGVSGVQKVPHQYYNDGRATTQNVFFGGKWHTVLVGTTGRGPAKAIYALDITDPSVLMDPSKADQALLWERSADDGKAGSNYIGEMVGQPVIGLVDQGGSTSWAVFIGNGYNSAANKAALLQFNIQTGALTVHPTDNTTANGLAEPGLEQPDRTTGVSTLAYAGDLHGNVWKFDLSSDNSTGSNIFTAKGPSGGTQPITSLVALTYNIKTDSTWAVFGTGKYLAQGDLNDNSVQTWYGLRVDTKSGDTTTNPVVKSTSTRGNDLVERTIVAESTAADGSVIRATSQQSSATDMSGKVGWYMDLKPKAGTAQGERIINRTQFIQGMAVVTTLIPKVNDPCDTFPSGAIMIVDPYTGANFSSALGDFNGDGTIDTGDTTSNGVPFNGKVFGKGPAGPVTATLNADGTVSLGFNTVDGKIGSLGPINAAGGPASRVSWRELITQ